MYDIGRTKIENARHDQIGATEPRPMTPLDEVIERLTKLRFGMDEAAIRLNVQADAVSGQVPQSASSGVSATPPPPEALIGRLLEATTMAEASFGRLAEAAGRNCWAV